MRILLTNDDGYRAEGINLLFDALVEAEHDVIMVAPELNSSGAGQSITVYSPISITKASKNKYFVSSTPADSVRLGLQELYEIPNNYPNLVISGINLGENLGEDVFYSGTIGAAREGVLHGVPSLAFSIGPEFNHLNSGVKVVIDLVERLEKIPQVLEKPFIWNINIPNKPYNLITGYETTELGMREPHLPLEKQITPRGQIVYWQGHPGKVQHPIVGTDIDVFIKQEKVSITPLELLPTDYEQMPVISALTV